MNPTIAKPLRQRLVTTEDLSYWANRELIPLLSQVKGVLDQVYLTKATIPTVHTGTFTTIWASPDLALGFEWLIEAQIQAHATTARSAWIIRGLFTNPGTIAQEGATAAVYTQTVAGFAVRFLVVSNHVEVQVQDDGVLSVNWGAWIQLRENP